MASWLSLFLFFVFHRLSTAADLCCEGACVTEGEEKYYSIDTRFNTCGECCMRPEDFDLYQKFEKGLTASNGTITPCADLDYIYYIKTETHGAGPIKMTLDMYSPDVSRG
jgi:hypothetical protein